LKFIPAGRKRRNPLARSPGNILSLAPSPVAATSAPYQVAPVPSGNSLENPLRTRIRRGRRAVARASADIEAGIHGAINQRSPTNYPDYLIATYLQSRCFLRDDDDGEGRDTAAALSDLVQPEIDFLRDTSNRMLTARTASAGSSADSCRCSPRGSVRIPRGGE